MGLLNTYRANMPWLEQGWKEVFFLVQAIGLYIQNKGKDKLIVTYPDLPSKKAVLYKIARVLGYRISNKISSRAHLFVFYENKTIKTNYAPLVPYATKVINLGSRNISKTFVDEQHELFFGYSTRINPATYQGKAVMKSNVNAVHDGKEVSCPVDSLVEDTIYQITIDNTIDAYTVQDYRVPVINFHIPFVYIKYKTMEKRFTNDTIDASMVEVSSVFSSTEITQIGSFCQLIGLQYGELDILRHKDDGRIYIIDVNNTPYGPPKDISKGQGKQALEKVSQLFYTSFLKK